MALSMISTARPAAPAPEFPTSRILAKPELKGKEKEVTIKEIQDPELIEKVDEILNQEDNIEILMSKGYKEKIVDGKDKVKSLKIKNKVHCAPKELVYYVYVFKARESIRASKKEGGVSKVMAFYKDDYVFVYSRHGDCFPEDDDIVPFRSDRTNRNPVDGNTITKRFIYVRDFKTVAENCTFIGRRTCRVAAVVQGTTHEVNNITKTINVYGILMNADKTNQKKKDRVDDDPKEFDKETLWIEYNPADAAAAAVNEMKIRTFSSIKTMDEAAKDENKNNNKEVEEEEEERADDNEAADGFAQKAFTGASKAASPLCSATLTQNLEAEKRTPTITMVEAELRSDAKDNITDIDSDTLSESESENEEGENESEEEAESDFDSDSGSASSSDSDEEMEVDESDPENAAEKGFSGYIGFNYPLPPLSSSSSSSAADSPATTMTSQPDSPASWTRKVESRQYEPMENVDDQKCWGPVEPLEIATPQRDDDGRKAGGDLQKDIDFSSLKRKTVLVNNQLCVRLNGKLYNLDNLLYSLDDYAELEGLCPPAKKARCF